MTAHETQPPVIGVIGGSGIYDLDGLTEKHWRRVTTPFGDPSDDLLHGELNGQKMVFLPRHGRGHRRSPTDLNYRANICALKMAGATEILSLSACGSLKEELPPGTFVIVDQFIDRTFAREKSFFEPGLVAHVSMAHPVCGRLGAHIAAAAAQIGIPHVRGGTYLTMEGPQFSTLAESNLYRSWGCDVIGMTNMPEAKLAREAELCYGAVCFVTDYDVWHEGEDDVTASIVMARLQQNAAAGLEVVRSAIAALPATRACGCGQALATALITPRELVPIETRRRLAPLLAPYWGHDIGGSA